MIWTLIVACIFIVSLLIVIFANHRYEVLTIISCTSMCASLIILVLMLISIIDAHSFKERRIASLRTEREAIVYQMEHGLYLGDCLGDFNNKILSNRYEYENPWTSWFQSDYVYEVDPIELN